MCPICFRFYNEILECVSCDNYLCISCARDLIKYELKRTKALVPQPSEDEVQITCPHCLKQSVTSECLYQDVDKTKQLKVYTDSPLCSGGGTVILGITTGGGGTPHFDEAVLNVKITTIVKQRR